MDELKPTSMARGKPPPEIALKLEIARIQPDGSTLNPVLFLFPKQRDLSESSIIKRPDDWLK